MENYCDLILMPYNYILDANLVSRFGKIISGSILVFDEAHNVAEAACEGRSYTLLLRDTEGAEAQLNKIKYRRKKKSENVKK